MDNYFKENFCCTIDYLIPSIIEGFKKNSVSSFLCFNTNPNRKYVHTFELPNIYYIEQKSQFCILGKLYYTELELELYLINFSEQIFLKPEFTSLFLGIHNVHTYPQVKDGCTFYYFDNFKFDYQLLQNFIENHKNIQNF